MPQIVFDDELDKRLEEALPNLFRGERKSTLRIEYAAERFLESLKSECSPASRDDDSSAARAANSK